MSTIKEKLIKAIKSLDESIAEKLYNEWEDILLQLKLENDESFLEDVEKTRKGIDTIDHDSLKKELGL